MPLAIRRSTAPYRHSGTEALAITLTRSSAYRPITPLQNDAYISAILDVDYNTISAVFWDASGGTLFIDNGSFSSGPTSITVNGAVALMLDLDTMTFTVSDPSQTLTGVNILVEGVKETPLACTVNFPPGPGGLAGSSVTVSCFPIIPSQHRV